MTRPHAGLLITLEGGEGGGKTTQIARLKDRLADAGKEIIVVREPGGTAISEQIRSIVLSKDDNGMDYTTEVLLFQAARAQIYAEIVLPALDAGKVVVMDRSRDSSLVYQGIVRNLGVDFIENLNKTSTKDTYPDMTILLDVETEVGLHRAESGGKPNRFEKESIEFHKRVREAYKKLAADDTTGRWRVIDANQSLEEVEAEIWRMVSSALSL